MKKIIIITVIVLALLIGLILTMNGKGGNVIQTALNENSNTYLGLTITSEYSGYAFVGSRMAIMGLKVKNPTDFKDSSAIIIEEIHGGLEPFSLFSDKIEFTDILIEDIKITIVDLGDKNNLLAIQSIIGDLESNFPKTNQIISIKEFSIKKGSINFENSSGETSKPNIAFPAFSIKNLEGPGPEVMAEIISKVIGLALTTIENNNRINS